MANLIYLTQDQKDKSSTEPSGFIGKDVNATKVKFTYVKDTSNPKFKFYTHKGTGLNQDFMVSADSLNWMAEKQGKVIEAVDATKGKYSYDLDKIVVEVKAGKYLP